MRFSDTYLANLQRRHTAIANELRQQQDAELAQLLIDTATTLEDRPNEHYNTPR